MGANVLVEFEGNVFLIGGIFFKVWGKKLFWDRENQLVWELYGPLLFHCISMLLNKIQGEIILLQIYFNFFSFQYFQKLFDLRQKLILGILIKAISKTGFYAVSFFKRFANFLNSVFHD